MQEERQRGKDRNENEVESTSSANEDMPVEKILEAELAVEPKTETYVEANMGLNPSSVSLKTFICLSLPLLLTRLPSCLNSQWTRVLWLLWSLIPNSGTSVLLGDPVSALLCLGYTWGAVSALSKCSADSGPGPAVTVGSWLMCMVRLDFRAREFSREAIGS